MIRKYTSDDIEKMLAIWLKGSIQSHDFVSNEYWHNMLPIIKKYYLPNTESFVFEDKRMDETLKPLEEKMTYSYWPTN